MPTIIRSRKRHARTGRVEWTGVQATSDQDIERHIAADPDTAPELTEEALDRAVIVRADGTRTPYRDRVPRPQSSGLLSPGSRAPESGIYRVVGPSGESTDMQRTVSIARGDRLPPTPKADQRWQSVEAARRKASA